MEVYRIRCEWEFIEDVSEIANIPCEESVEFDNLACVPFTDRATMQICIIRQGDKYGVYTLDHTLGFGGPGTWCSPTFNPFPYNEVKCCIFATDYPNEHCYLAFRIGEKWGIIKVVDGQNEEEGVYDVEYRATKRKIIVPCEYLSLAEAEKQLSEKCNWQDPFVDNYHNTI